MERTKLDTLKEMIAAVHKLYPDAEIQLSVYGVGFNELPFDATIREEIKDDKKIRSGTGFAYWDSKGREKIYFSAQKVVANITYTETPL